MPDPPIPVPYVPNHPCRTHFLLVAILVPILVFLLVVVLCVILVARWRRRRAVRFMPDYAFVSNLPNSEYAYHDGQMSNQSVATTGPSDHGSVPSTSMVHTDLMDCNYVPLNRTPSIRHNLLTSRDEDVRSPLFLDTSVLPALASERQTPSPSPSSIRSQSNWRALSPTASISESIHRVRSRIGTLASTRSSTRSPSDSRANPSPLSPMLYKNSGRGSHSDDPFADADWDHMDDPFANWNARSADLDEGLRDNFRKTSIGSSARSMLLQKTRPRS